MLNKQLCIFTTALLLCLSFTIQASDMKPVLLQAFHWDVPINPAEGSWWKKLEYESSTIQSSGIDAVWLPPPYKGVTGVQDSGYGVYDLYDLGEFDQKGSVRTRYGTLNELESTIRSFHDKGVKVFGDVAINHLMGADEQESFSFQGEKFKEWTHFTYAGRNKAHSTFQWNHNLFSGCKEKDWKLWNAGWDFEATPIMWDNLIGCEIRYQLKEAREEVISWGKWFTQKLNLDGYRLDATKHIRNDFIIEWLDKVAENRFAVSEAWLGGLGELREYLKGIQHKSKVFDFPLFYTIRGVFNQNGSGDARTLKFAGLTEVEGDYAVSFLENHDSAVHDPLKFQKLSGYAYLLTRANGTPCIFYSDLFDGRFTKAISNLISIRKTYANGPGWEHDETDENVYVYSRRGTRRATGLLLLINDSGKIQKRVKTQFLSKKLVDATGNNQETVQSDAEGNATFTIPSQSYGVWVAK